MIENKKNEKANLENKKSLFFLIGLVVALGSVLCAFEWKTHETNEVMNLGNSDFIAEDFVFIPRTPAEKIELPKPIVKVALFDIVDNQSSIDERFEVFSSEPDETMDVDFNNINFYPTTEDVDKDEVIFLTAEVMPGFPGGERALVSYLANHVKYPLIAQENGIKGKVYVSFVIDENGNVNNVSLLRGIDMALDNEAIRVVTGMPKWKPGMQAGKAVKVRYTVPINFELR